MVATMDVMIFVTLLALVSVTLISIQPAESANPDASEILDDIENIRLGSDLIVENGGNIPLGVWDIYAMSALSDDKEFIHSYLENVISDIIGGRYSFAMEIQIGEWSDSITGESTGSSNIPISECARSVTAMNGQTVSVHLTIY